MQKTQQDQNTRDDGRDKQHLSLSGLSLLAGDVFLYGSSRKSGKKGIGTVLTSVGWGVGGLAALLFGKTPENRVARVEARKLDHFLKGQGIDIPRTVRDRSPLLGSDGLLDSAQQLFYTYPSEVLNGVYGLFSLGMIRDGLKHPEKRSLLWGGLSVVSGALVGLFVKEDPDARKKAEHSNMADKATAFVREKPLRTSGAIYMLNDVFLAKQALQEYKEHYKPSGGKDKRHIYTLGAVVTYALGNMFLWFSSRDSSKEGRIRPGDRMQLKDLAVEIVAAQPPHLKDKTFSLVMDYLTKDRDVELNVDGIREQLTEKITDVQQRRIDEVATRGWRTRHEAQKHSQEHKEHAPHPTVR